MNSSGKIIAIVGSYRKGGVVDTVTDAVLDAARQDGAETEKVYLIDRHIEFCTNCRTCTQTEGSEPGTCQLEDDLQEILARIAEADGLVIGSPMNFFTVTAVTKRFVERLVCFAHWPWGAGIPKTRSRPKDKLAVVIGSAAAPAVMARTMTGMVRLLKSVAGLLGARTIGVVFVGMAAAQPEPRISRRTLRKAERLGRKLAAHRAGRAPQAA